MAATCQLQLAYGAAPGTLADAEGGWLYSRDDTPNGLLAPTAAPIPLPAATGQRYSALRTLALVVTATAATTISNRRLQLGAALPTGLYLYFQGRATYTPNTLTPGQAPGQFPANVVGSTGVTPGGYTLASTAAAYYDQTSVSAGALGVNGAYCVTTLGVDSTYTGGADATTALVSVLILYDES